MLEIIMRYVGKDKDEKYVLADNDELYVFNKDKCEVSNLTFMSGLYEVHEVIEDIDISEDDVYVNDIDNIKECLEENEDEFNFDVNDIINHLKSMR